MRQASGRNYGKSGREHGTALIVSLIFLLLLTILGVTAMSMTGLQEKMAGNMYDQDLAFQAGETALYGGQTYLDTLALSGKPTPDSAGSNGVWTPLSPSVTIDDNTWWGTNSKAYAPSIAGIAADPRYVVEQIAFVPDSLNIKRNGPPPGVYYYRITSRAVGKTSASQAELQITYQVRYN